MTQIIDYTSRNSLSRFLKNLKSIFATKDVVKGATSSSNGQSGLVPAPIAGDEKKCLLGNGTYGYLEMIDISNDNTYEELEGGT